MKKILSIAVYCLLTIGLMGCNSAKIDQLNDQVIQLQKDNELLTQELDLEKQKNEEKRLLIEKLEGEIEANKNIFEVSIEDIQLISDDMYQEGTVKGSIYGGFDVAVKVKNQSQNDLENIKTTVKMETSIGHYSRSLTVKTSKIAAIKTLKAGEEKEIIFTGFHVDHPEMIQELIVNVVDHGEIKKIKIPSAFPPGSQD